MNHTNIATILCIGFYWILLGAAITIPIWGSKLIEYLLSPKHKALKTRSPYKSNSAILASIGTTTAGVFLIQILPLIFSIIGDIGAGFNINTLYGEHLNGGISSEYLDSFYGLTAQLGEILQTIAPIAAVGLGGYNLLNNISRGLPAITINNSNDQNIQKL